jgi:HD-GYP domain-containing protein (c-di-GMP phosphodiesterase class II)
MIPAPPPLAIRDNSGQAVSALRRRCAALGLPTWRCDNAGLILAEPEDTGPVGLLWGSAAFTKLVSNAGRSMGSTGAGVQEVFPGAWTIALTEERRRSRSGCVVALALSPQGLESEFFQKSCVDAALDAHAVRRLLIARARYTAESAVSMRDAMLWMAQDLAHVEESDHTSSAFTRQLSDAFETIDLLYALGRSMNDLAQPEQFVRSLAARVRATLSFGWVAGWFLPCPGSEGDGLSGRTILSGQTVLADAFDRALPPELAKLDGDPHAVVLSELNGAPIPGSGQILAHPVLRSGKPAGFVLAGDKFGNDPQVSSYDIQLLEAAAGYVGAFMENSSLYARQKALSLGVLESLTAAIDAKDTYTCGHSQRVAHLSQQLALASGMSIEQAERVRIAGLVHDVGKIGVPEAVLCKSGKLTDEEFDAIKKHPEMGYKILKDLPLLEDILPGVLYHHERWDGRGYPHKIVAEAIPPIARIIALADTFDAMSSNRSYRSAMPRTKVLAEIERCAGSQFDPALAKLFITLDMSEFDRMVARHAAQQAAAAPATPPALPAAEQPPMKLAA